MSHPLTIAVTGKGGTGKTTLTALLLDELLQQATASILTVDADPAATLHLALGLPTPTTTLADIRETTVLDAQTIRHLPIGVTPTDYVSDRLSETGVMTEHQRHQQPFELLTMGQPQGAGCYCAVNRALTTALDALLAQYQIVLIDCEAGLEHLSRHRLQRIDYLLVVATPPSQASVVVSRQILQTVEALQLDVHYRILLLNRAQPRMMNGVDIACDWINVLPNAPELAALESVGLPAVDLPATHALRLALRPLVTQLVQKASAEDRVVQ